MALLGSWPSWLKAMIVRIRRGLQWVTLRSRSARSVPPLKRPGCGSQSSPRAELDVK